MDNVEKVNTPWKKLFKNSQFWAIGLEYFGVAWITTMLMVWLPTYLLEAKHFSLQSMGIAAMFPWIAIGVVVLMGGVISDNLLKWKNNYMLARGLPAIVGLSVYIGTLCAATYTTSNVMSVFWLTVALGAIGLPIVSSWASAADKGKQYSGSVSGWMNLWGNLGGVVSPIITGWLAQTSDWDIALLFSVIPVVLAMFLWYFIKPDIAMLPEEKV